MCVLNWIHLLDIFVAAALPPLLLSVFLRLSLGLLCLCTFCYRTSTFFHRPPRSRQLHPRSSLPVSLSRGPCVPSVSVSPCQSLPRSVSHSLSRPPRCLWSLFFPAPAPLPRVSLSLCVFLSVSLAVFPEPSQDDLHTPCSSILQVVNDNALICMGRISPDHSLWSSCW